MVVIIDLHVDLFLLMMLFDNLNFGCALAAEDAAADAAARAIGALGDDNQKDEEEDDRAHDDDWHDDGHCVHCSICVTVVGSDIDHAAIGITVVIVGWAII